MLPSRGPVRSWSRRHLLAAALAAATLAATALALAAAAFALAAATFSLAPAAFATTTAATTTAATTAFALLQRLPLRWWRQLQRWRARRRVCKLRLRLRLH